MHEKCEHILKYLLDTKALKETKTRPQVVGMSLLENYNPDHYNRSTPKLLGKVMVQIRDEEMKKEEIY